MVMKKAKSEPPPVRLGQWDNEVVPSAMALSSTGPMLRTANSGPLTFRKEAAGLFHLPGDDLKRDKQRLAMRSAAAGSSNR